MQTYKYFVSFALSPGGFASTCVDVDEPITTQETILAIERYLAERTGKQAVLINFVLMSQTAA